MFRLGVNRFSSLKSRVFATGATQAAAHSVKESGLRSVLAQRIVIHQKNQSRAYHGTKIHNDVILEQAHARSRGVRGLSTEPSHLEAQETMEPSREAAIIMNRLDDSFNRFEDRCQRVEKVYEKDFVRIFDFFTRSVERLNSLGPVNDDIRINLAVLSGILIRCCGRLMTEVPPKVREMLAGNAWQFVKEKKIPLDTSLYNSLIKILNENQTMVDPQTLLDEMKAANLKPDRVTYQRLIHQYCFQGDVTSATKLLEIMKENNMELNEATFASLIFGYSMQDNPPSMDEMFELMRNNGIEPGSQSYAAAILSQARLLKKNVPKATDELTKLDQTIQDQDIHFSVYEISEMISELGPLSEHEIVDKIMKRLTKSAVTNMNSRQRLFGVLLDCGQLEEASNHFWSKEPTDRARSSGRAGSFYIRLLGISKNVPVDHAISECSRMIASNLNLNAFHQLYYVAANAGNLELVRACLKKIGETETLKCHYYWPLLAQAKDNNEILKVLKEDLNPNMDTYGLLETFSEWVWPKFCENPHILLEHNKNELKYDNGLLISSYLEHCVYSNKVVEAIKFVSELPAEETSHQKHEEQAKDLEDNEQDDLDEPSVNQNQLLSASRGNLISRLLNLIAEQTKDPVMVDKALELCKNPGFRLTSKTLQPVIKVRLENEDGFNSALNCFLDIAEKYNLTPCKFDLMLICLDKKDSASLQKIMDASTKIYGEANSLFDLACACIKGGKMKQANKVLSSPGFRVHPSRVYNACRSLFRQQKLETLENFVFATKGLPEVNQDYLYDILLEAYYKSGDQKRALDLWNRMQEEDFQPSKKVLIQIARVLQSKNIQVPFQIPKNYSRVAG